MFNLTEEALQLLQEKIKNIEIQTHYHAMQVFADPKRIEQVLINIIER